MPSLSLNRKRSAHLYRRAGFGGLPEELDRAAAMGRKATVDRLVNFEQIPTTTQSDQYAVLGTKYPTIGFL